MRWYVGQAQCRRKHNKYVYFTPLIDEAHQWVGVERALSDTRVRREFQAIVKWVDASGSGLTAVQQGSSASKPTLKKFTTASDTQALSVVIVNFDA